MTGTGKSAASFGSITSSADGPPVETPITTISTGALARQTAVDARAADSRGSGSTPTSSVALVCPRTSGERLMSSSGERGDLGQQLVGQRLSAAVEVALLAGLHHVVRRAQRERVQGGARAALCIGAAHDHRQPGLFRRAAVPAHPAHASVASPDPAPPRRGAAAARRRDTPRHPPRCRRAPSPAGRWSASAAASEKSVRSTPRITAESSTASTRIGLAVPVCMFTAPFPVLLQSATSCVMPPGQASSASRAGSPG